MRYVINRFVLVLASLVVLAPQVSVFAQSGQLMALRERNESNGLVQAASSAIQPAAIVRRLSVDDAVRLALEQNLGIQIERLNPRIQDMAIAQARSLWTPNVTSSITNNSTNTAPSNSFSGGQTKVTDSRFTTELGVNQVLKTGANYTVNWSSFRASSTNIFNTYDPQISSTLSLNVTQPLLKNYKIDTIRQQLEVSRKDRDASDLQLQTTITATTRNVKNAYWELAYQIASLNAARQSLDLSKRLLGDNEKRVQIGTMAPIDIVEAKSEVARNEEAVIVAEAAIKRAEDNLRALIYDPAAPDFWNIEIEPSETAPFTALTVDVDGAVRHALENRTDIKLAQNGLQRDDINIKYYSNQTMPEVDAIFNYRSASVGGVQLKGLTSLDLSTIGTTPRQIVAQRSYASVLGDVLSSAFPVWTIGVNVSYPVGTSTNETNLARTRLQREQSERQLKNLELQITTAVRDAARNVQTNQKRVDSARAARELAEQRLDAEQKKFAAGIQTSFFVFQAQRDLATARTTEVRAISDYNKSLVDFEAVQEAPLR